MAGIVTIVLSIEVGRSGRIVRIVVSDMIGNWPKKVVVGRVDLRRESMNFHGREVRVEA